MMNILCPCNKKVNIKVTNGIIMYIHEDGTICKTLNRFYSDQCANYVWSICEQAIKDNDYETFNTYMCRITSGVRDKLLEYVKCMFKTELIDVFMFLFSNSNVDANILLAITDDLVKHHGRVAYNNIRAIAGEAVMMRNQRITENGHYIVKESKMPDISQELRKSKGLVKSNIVDDLAKSFMIEKSIRNAEIRKGIRNAINSSTTSPWIQHPSCKHTTIK